MSNGDKGLSRGNIWFTEPSGRFLRVGRRVDDDDGSKLHEQTWAAGYLPQLTTVQNSDFRLIPDKSTRFRTNLSREGLVENVIGSITQDGQSNELDSRRILENTLKASEMGTFENVSFNVGFELEYRCFSSVNFAIGLDETNIQLKQPTSSLDNLSGKINFHSILDPKFHLATNDDFLQPFRDVLDEHLLFAGIRNLHVSSEVGFGQGEISLPDSGPVSAADKLQVSKQIAKAVALDHGLYLTFMPMPIAYRCPSGLHINISAWDDNKNLLFESPNVLSSFGKHLVAGILEHKKALTLRLCPSLNSYCRLNYLYHGGANAGYGEGHRGAYIRIPKTDSMEAARIEVRFADCLTNPYFALSSIILAMQDGAQRELELEAENLEYAHPPTFSNLSERNKSALPKDLEAAILAFQADSDFMKYQDVFPTSMVEKTVRDATSLVLGRASIPHPMDYSQAFGH